VLHTLLITGAAGGVASQLRPLLRGVYPHVRLTDLRAPDHLEEGESFVGADLAELGEVEKVVAGVQAVIHFGGVSVEGPWEDILEANIAGCRNLFEAARRQCVERIVFASSNHVVGYFPRHRRIGTGDPVRPDSRYGVSKAFGEALGAMYAYKYGMRVACIRIGHVADAPVDRRRLSSWVSPQDFAQLVRIGLESPSLRYEIFYGASANERSWWDNSAAYRYGYRPTGRAEAFRDRVEAAERETAGSAVDEWYQGGPFCAAESAPDLPLEAD
jgi:uronate dehydrogenase